MQPIIWVARPDKTGWNATRARDRVDYSFCVYRETDTLPARLVVRETYTDSPGARARKVIGEFVFPTAKRAKQLVVETLASLNDEAVYPSAINTKPIQRDRFMREMMGHSIDESSVKYHAECIWYNDVFMNEIVKPYPTVVSAVAYAVSPQPSETVEYTEQDELEQAMRLMDGSGKYPPADSLKEDVMEAMQILEQAEQMFEQMPESVFDPDNWRAGDPVPSGWINMGGKLIQLSWPK